MTQQVLCLRRYPKYLYACQCIPQLESLLSRQQDAQGGNGTGADAGASKSPTKERKPFKGVALQQLLKLLLSIAGPKILALVGLALARTALSNRLARLQVWRGVAGGAD